ncbi:15448_t:CDS:2 [Dentiscutata heterogama]|uniref:15448_t:CDS:1 n=1 Tax=Dentiscutata heterogama TaxID=1316150 RepID=A0ACA9LQ49_9GLOM|nr:15448_t:CDS:2 [Dentiscutata heterogama]
MVEEKSHSSKTGITASLEALTINRVKQEPNNDSKIDKIESDIKKLMKVVKELTSNNSSSVFSHSRNPNSVQNSRPQKRNVDNHRYFNCQQEGHISCNYPNIILQNLPVEQGNKQTDARNKAIEIKDANIQYFEVTSGSDNLGIECLKVEMVKGEPIFNVRNWDLRKRKCTDVPMKMSDDENDEMDVPLMRRVQIDKPEIEKMNTEYKEIISKANNSNQLMLQELIPIDDDQLEENKHRGQIIYWSANQKNKGDINVGGPDLIMRLTVENSKMLDINPEISMKNRFT